MVKLFSIIYDHCGCMFLQKVKVGLTSLAQRAETSKKLQSPWGPEFRKKIESSYPDILIWTFWQYWRARNRKYIFLTQLQFLSRYDYYCRVSLYQEKGKGAPQTEQVHTYLCPMEKILVFQMLVPIQLLVHSGSLQQRWILSTISTSLIRERI